MQSCYIVSLSGLICSLLKCSCMQREGGRVGATSHGPIVLRTIFANAPKVRSNWNSCSHVWFGLRKKSAKCRQPEPVPPLSAHRMHKTGSKSRRKYHQLCTVNALVNGYVVWNWFCSIWVCTAAYYYLHRSTNVDTCACGIAHICIWKIGAPCMLFQVFLTIYLYR